MKRNIQKNIKLFLVIICVIVSLFLIHRERTEGQTLISQTITHDSILEKRKNFFNSNELSPKRILNILIVAGHDDESYGAKFRQTKEVELNRIVAQKLYNYLLMEDGINPVLVSDQNGYTEIFNSYFLYEKNEINNFIRDVKNKFSEKIQEEEFNKIEKNFHNVASDETVYKLYGINSWVNKRNFDLVIHIHFNDYAGRQKNNRGRYEGFSVYVPGKLFSNHELSSLLGENIFNELKKINKVSNLEEEKNGVVEDHELIALGAHESLNAGSVLIEYGYIYEPLFLDKEKREIVFDYFAYATYRGIKNMLGEIPKEKEIGELKISRNKFSKSNLIWQFEKAIKGDYPPKEKSLKDCPITGYFGRCSILVK